MPAAAFLAVMIQEEAVLAVIIQSQPFPWECGDKCIITRWHALPTARNMAFVKKTAHVFVTRAGEVEDVRRGCIS
jgi:hypothetical protein